MAASLLPDSTSCFFPCPLSFFFFGSFLVHLPFVFPLSSFQVSCACGFVGSMRFLWQFFKIIEKDLSDCLTEMKRSTFMGWCTTNSGDLNLIILKVWNSNNFLPKQLEPGILCSVTKKLPLMFLPQYSGVRLQSQFNATNWGNNNNYIICIFCILGWSNGGNLEKLWACFALTNIWIVTMELCGIDAAFRFSFVGKWNGWTFSYFIEIMHQNVETVCAISVEMTARWRFGWSRLLWLLAPLCHADMYITMEDVRRFEEGQWQIGSEADSFCKVDWVGNVTWQCWRTNRKGSIHYISILWIVGLRFWLSKISNAA